MDGAVTVVVAGIGAFSAFMPPLTGSGADPERERIGLIYASAATLAIGYMSARVSSNSFPLTMAGMVIAFEWLAYYHARRITSFPFNG